MKKITFVRFREGRVGRGEDGASLTTLTCDAKFKFTKRMSHDDAFPDDDVVSVNLG